MTSFSEFISSFDLSKSPLFTSWVITTISALSSLDASEDKAEIGVITHEVNNGDFEKSKDEINSLNEVKIIASQLSCI